MQSIKSELDRDKEMWIIRVINVLSLVMGTFLIIFAILFILAYWFDIFNTLTDFSLLQFISFGNLHSVSDKDTGMYLANLKGLNIKYVTFKDVMIIAIIMIAIGLLFVNVTTLIGMIINIYNYIIYLFGRL